VTRGRIIVEGNCSFSTKDIGAAPLFIRQDNNKKEGKGD